MIKKFLLLTVVLGVGLLFFAGRESRSYFRTMSDQIKKSVKAEVPIEFEIERARNMVENLLPEIRQSIHVVAKQRVEVERITKRIDKTETALSEQKKTILAMRDDLSNLDDGETQLVYLGRSFEVEEVNRDLSKRFERFKVAKETLSHEKKLLKAHQEMLTANRVKLQTMLSQKKDLKLQLTRLEARMKSIQASEAVSSLAIDDSQLGRAKSLIEELNTQLDVKQKMLDAEGEFSDLIEFDVKRDDVPLDIDQQIDSYFKTESDTKEDSKKESLVKKEMKKETKSDTQISESDLVLN